MDKRIKEWVLQAEYDAATAQAMLDAERHIYCVFMCHLAIEKILKGLYLSKLKEVPPKVHSLVYLIQVQKLTLTKKDNRFLEELDEVSVPTRYPDELRLLLKVYSKKRTQNILKRTKEVLKCLKKKFEI